MENSIIYFNGRPDGIGNRIEQLIYIQQYCKENNLQCIYIWNNSYFRNYKCLISFENITIKDKITEKEKKYLTNDCFLRTPEYIVKYNFLFTIPSPPVYDVIIHIRGTDRLNPSIKHHDFSNVTELNNIMEKTINYLNNEKTITTYTVVTDDKQYINYMKNKIQKEYIELSYNHDIHNDWIDFYYLTQPKKFILMCCRFSSYSITASILGNKEIRIFKESIDSALPRYKSNIKIIS